MSLAVQSAFRIGPIATIRRMSGPLAIWPLFPTALGGLERSGSIALPDRIHRFIPLVANGPRHYFALRDDTETESSRGTRPFASSLVSQGGWNDCGYWTTERASRFQLRGARCSRSCRQAALRRSTPPRAPASPA